MKIIAYQNLQSAEKALTEGKFFSFKCIIRGEERSKGTDLSFSSTTNLELDQHIKTQSMKERIKGGGKPETMYQNR